VSHPAQIGDYDILGRFTEGGMAELFFARHRAGGPVVCLKRILPDCVDDEDGTLVEEFAAEVEIASQLHHPNIVEVFDHGEDEGPFYTMELVEGPDLETFLHHEGARRTLPSELVAYVGAEIARPLMYLHRTDPATGRKPLVHSDVTPHNVLLAPSGAVKLSDFGLVRVLRQTGAETLTRGRGKVSYLSPEQWLGEPVGSRSDLFSLGLVLWRALIGPHPYAEGRPRTQPMGVEAWIQQQTIANARRRAVDAAPGARPELTGVIDRLLQPVDQRLSSAEEVYALLSPLAPYDAHEKLARQLTWEHARFVARLARLGGER